MVTISKEERSYKKGRKGIERRKGGSGGGEREKSKKTGRKAQVSEDQGFLQGAAVSNNISIGF